MLEKEFVIRVNKIFHDVEAAAYTSEHPEIFELEQQRWQVLSVKFFKTGKPLRILDLGSGTGFVPLEIGPYLKAGDEVICADVSEKMLERCRENLERRNFKNKFNYLKLEDQRLAIEDQSVDLVTLNSVLHHLPQTAESLAEVSRVLKPGGLLIIAHERFLMEAIMKRLGLKKLFDEKFQDQSGYTPKLEKVNQQLIAEGLISEPLSPWKMGKIVDYYSATGFSVKEILKAYLPGYQMIFFETYNHLYRVFMYAHRNLILKWYNGLLSKLFPKNGATFTAVFKKYE